MSFAIPGESVAKTAVRQKAPGILAWLIAYPPFDQMQRQHCDYLIEHSELRFFSAEQVLFEAGARVDQLYIIRQGQVCAQEQGETHEYVEGDLLPVRELVSGQPLGSAYTVQEDCFALCVAGEAVAHLLIISEPFRDYCLRGTSSLLASVWRSAQQSASADLGASYTLDMSLQALTERGLLSCLPDCPVEQAVKDMHERQVSSMVVVNPDTHLLGIFTLRDLRRLVAGGQYDPTQAMSQVMTPDPVWLSPQASAFDAALLMVEHQIGHICLVQDHKVVGMVSERDVFSLQRVDLVHLSRALRCAQDVSVLVRLQSDIGRLVDAMLAHGARSEQLTAVITRLNDHTVQRTIELTLPGSGLDGIEFCWLAFGSQARGEQTRHTDQDNGILFLANSPEQTKAYRALLLPFALRVNEALDRCGMAWCTGNIMASNPELCLSEAEWLHRFQIMIERPAPEQLLESTIYFDCRAIWGQSSLLHRMQRRVLGMVNDNHVFQRMLAQSTCQTRIPSGKKRSRLEALMGQGDDKIDIKKHALAPMVDVLRVLALAHGCELPSSLDRLAVLTQRGVFTAEESEGLCEAYRYLQLLRLQHHQTQLQQGQEPNNLVRLSGLGALDARVLREALSQVRRAQRILAFRYRL
ncbi:CBS domain-containing protein [Providencia rettgeri]|nr:CBS domain-containing protein [Providencia rettgeri]